MEFHGLSGDPRPLLTEYILSTYGNDAIHYTHDMNASSIRYVCKPKKNDPSKLVRGLVYPTGSEKEAIEDRINSYEGDTILFHVIMEQKADCNAPKDGRTHGVMLLYNRATKEVYTYDILRYHYRGFKANVLNKMVASSFIPWLENVDLSGMQMNSDDSIEQANMVIKHTSQRVIEFLTEKHGRKPYAREWYPLLALWEIHSILEMTDQTAEDVTSNMLELPTEDLFMLLEELYQSFHKFTEHVYSIYNLKCESTTKYDPELQSCVAVDKRSASISATKTRTSQSRSTLDIIDVGMVDSPKHVRHRMGNEYGQVIMMKYFAQNYPVKPFMPKTSTWNLMKSTYTISWDYDVVKKSWRLSYPKILPKFLKAMPSSEYAMVLVRLKSKPKDNGAAGYHLNTLLYNRKTNEIEHFEPHGSMLVDEYEPNELYKQMKGFLALHVPGIQYVQPSNFCMHKNFFQRIEGDEMGFAYEHGMCAVWCLWYIEVRLKNPELSRDDLVKRAMKELHRIGSFRIFIRNYEKYYMHMINDIVQKHYMKTTKSKMVLDPDSYFI